MPFTFAALKYRFRLSALGIVSISCYSILLARQAPPTSAQPQATIRVTVNSVLVPVIVTDEHGRAVPGLTQQDFQILDEGKPRAITGFSVQQQAPAPPVNPLPSTASSAPPVSPDATPATGASPRFVVFLFDDLHLSASDLMQVKKASTAMLGSALAPTDMAAVVSLSGSNSGLTSDRAQLQQAVSKLHMHNLFRQAMRECPDVDYYLADLIENKREDVALESAIDDALNCGHLQLREQAERMVHSAATRALALGDQDVRVSLGTILEMVRRLTALPGQRTLILISPGFLTLTGEALRQESEIMDLAAQSSVIVSTLDARGLYSAQIDASERGASTTKDLITSAPSQRRRDTMSQDRSVMSGLAAATGGTYFHDSNDLRGGFAQLAAAPEILYLLEFSLEGIKQDGRYHRLSIKLDDPRLRIRARPGYVRIKPANPKKQ